MTDTQALTELGAVLNRHVTSEAEELAAWTQANQHAWTEEYARSFTAAQRRKAAKEGAALSDGSFPIYNQEDAENAARLAGNGGASRSTVVAHIRKRVKTLGLKMPASLAAA
jgi:hypothetical protein